MSSRVYRAIVLALALGPALAWTEPALAQDECTAPYSHDAWRADMDGIDATFEAMNLDDARMKIDEAWRKVGCLDSVAKPGHIARFARQRALLYFFDQDEDNAIKWGLLQREAAPDFPWPESMGEEHPFRAMITEAELPPEGGPEASGLLVEKKSTVWLDGAPLLEPKARAETPHIVQVTDKKGTVVLTFWQDGAAFPTDMIVAGGAKLPAPEGWQKPGPGDYASAGGKLPYASGGAAVATADPVETKDPVEAKDPVETKDPKEPTEVATKDPKEPKEPKEPKPPKEPKEPKEGGGGGGIRVVSLAAGGGLAVVAGTMYYLGGQAGSTLMDQTSEADLVKVRTKANTMVIGGAVAGVAAVGVGVTAFVADDGVGVGLHWRW